MLTFADVCRYGGTYMARGPDELDNVTIPAIFVTQQAMH
jgi:hypothetical protein